MNSKRRKLLQALGGTGVMAAAQPYLSAPAFAQNTPLRVGIIAPKVIKDFGVSRGAFGIAMSAALVGFGLGSWGGGWGGDRGGSSRGPGGWGGDRGSGGWGGDRGSSFGGFRGPPGGGFPGRTGPAPHG